MPLMQRIIASHHLGHPGPTSMRRRLRQALMLSAIVTSMLPLAGCEGFPWDKKPQPQVEQVTALGGPSVTRGRPATPQPATKAKTKPKAKKPPVNPAPATPGPEIAAAPGQPVTPPGGDAATTNGQPNADQSQSGQTPPDQATTDQATGDQTTGDQTG